MCVCVCVCVCVCFFSHARITGEGSTNHSPPVVFSPSVAQLVCTKYTLLGYGSSTMAQQTETIVGSVP